MGWLCEHGAVWSMMLVRISITRGVEFYSAGLSWWQRFLRVLIGMNVSDRVGLGIQHLLVHYVYGHIPYFQRPDENTAAQHAPSSLLWDWMQTTLISTSIIASRLVSKPIRPSMQSWSLIEQIRKVRPLAFVAKLVVARSIADVLFYAGHWLIHRPILFHNPPLYHKRHHQHRHPSVATNQHFTVPDVFVEAYLPVLTGSLVLSALRIKIQPLEELLIPTYLLWLEACSHSGKPVPFSTMVAPISPLYNFFFEWDRRNVEFHQVHHERMRCNYSITQWLDHLVGTSCFEVPPGTKAELQEPTEHDCAVLKLKVACDKVTAFKRKIDEEIEKSQEMAQQLVRMKRKERAMLALKRKKYLEKQYRTCDAELNNVKNLLCAFEFASVQQEVARSLDKGNEALQRLQNQISLEDAERIMEENAEALKYVEELSELLGHNLTEEDADDLEEELAAMMSEAGKLKLDRVSIQRQAGNEAQRPGPDLPLLPDTALLPKFPSHLQEPAGVDTKIAVQTVLF